MNPFRWLAPWWRRHVVAPDPTPPEVEPTGPGYARFTIEFDGKPIAWLIFSTQDMPYEESLAWIAGRLQNLIQRVCDIEQTSLAVRQTGQLIGSWKVCVWDEVAQRPVSLADVAAISPAYATELQGRLVVALANVAQKRKGC